MITMPTPHIFMFSNTEPNTQLFTEDRWIIEKIELSLREKEILKQKIDEKSQI